MALGVLNNLSAIYAQDNLNRTSNSLQTVLQQLSSGSRINSGADDSAGLSLVNGLQANATALTQSSINSTEGVGLLKVADGALSQVTNLLNRAITLATEASNGTLNSSQASAANQEYQSILSEINNIGSTTTYNQEQVFSGRTISIYTGDSSSTGSSIDNLYIRTLSSSSVGDTNGAISYTSGAGNIFLNLSSSAANAAKTDYLSGGVTGTTTINVNYLVQGSGNTSSVNIVAGAGTDYANTIEGMIAAINNSGLGLTATFATQTQAGVTGGGLQTGIEITGGQVSAGIDPSSVSTGGVLNVDGLDASALLTQGQVITVKEGGTQVAQVTISPAINTLTELKDAINTQAGAGTASVVTNGDGTQSLVLADNSAAGGLLSVTISPGTGATIPAFGTATTAVNAVSLAVVPASSVTGNAAVPAVNGSVTFGASGTNALADLLSAGGSITLQNSLSGTSVQFIVGAGTDVATGATQTYYTANHVGSSGASGTLGNLLDTINAAAAALGAAATFTVGNGIMVTASAALTGEDITASANTLSNANSQLSLYNPVSGGVATTGSRTVTAIDAGVTTGVDDVLNTGGSITLSNGTPAQNLVFTATAGQTFADLALQINGSSLGVVATWSAANHALMLTSTTNGAPAITASANTLTDTTIVHAVAIDPAYAVAGVAGTAGTYGTALLQLNSGNLNDATATLTGRITLTNGGLGYTFVMGAGADDVVNRIYYTGAATVASLVTKINSTAALGITANAPGTGTGAIYLQSTTTGTTIATTGTTTLASAVALPSQAAVPGVTIVAGHYSSIDVYVGSGSVGTNDLLVAGAHVTLANGLVSRTFVVGAGTDDASTYYTANHGDGSNTLANLATTISADSALGVTALANTSGLSLVSTAFDANPIVVSVNNLADASQGSASTITLGNLASQDALLTGAMTFTVGSTVKTVTATVGETAAELIARINLNTATLGVSAQWVPGSNGYGSIQLTSATIGTSGQISAASSSVQDVTATATLSYTASSAYNIGMSGTITDSTTTQSGVFVANGAGSNGPAEINYTDSSGEDLSNTSLSTATSAQIALLALNRAITDSAAMDGYIGGQINLLNAISQVLSTQQENVVSAQDAMQATDYATAASNLSKFMILTQTGIAALAQANSVQKEVTKLLQ